MRIVPWTSILLLTPACLSLHAQQSIGTLKTEGAEISGMVAVSGGRATVGSSGTISTGTQPSDITLTRGGSVKVCTGSSVRLSQPSLGVTRPPMLAALNHGAVEIKTNAEKNDLILTPDLRLELSDAAPLNLHIRLIANGDTCVDNAGKDAPVIHATEAFGTGAYFIRPGQRVLFEHGSVSEVVDHESSNCGCPGSPDALVLAGKGKRGDGKVVPQAPAAQANPFPEAVSQGLQQPTVPQAASDQTHVQVSSTLAYNGTTDSVTGPPGETTSAAPMPASPDTPVANGRAAESPLTPAPQPTQGRVVDATPPPPGPNVFRSLGHFFKRLFGGH